MVVLDPLFCDQSTSTLPVRRDLAIRETTRAGRAFSSSSAASLAHSDAWLLVIGSSIGTYRCRPLLPLVTDRDPLAQRTEPFPQRQGDVDAFGQAGAGTGIQIEHHPIRVPLIRPAGDLRRAGGLLDPPLRDVQLQRGDLTQPRERRGGVEHRVELRSAIRAGSAPGSTTPGVPGSRSLTKNEASSTPSGHRFLVAGRPGTCGSITAETSA